MYQILFNLLKNFFLIFILVFLFIVDISIIHDGPFIFFKNISFSLLFLLVISGDKKYVNFVALIFGILIDWNNNTFLGLSSALLILILIFFRLFDRYFPDKFVFSFLKDMLFFFLSSLVFFNFYVDDVLNILLSGFIFCIIKNLIKYILL